MNTRTRLHPVNVYTTLIDDDGQSTAYLICGQERAVLIDTLNGAEDLAELTRSLTSLPVMVVNTHGHLDHIGCNHFFPEAWMHQEDYSIYREHLGFVQQALRESGAPVPTGEECEIRFLEPDTAIDLGGVTLEVVAIPGHTPGSIALLDRMARLLYTGDAINEGIWMHLDHSTPLSVYLASLNALDTLRPAFDGMYGGHVREASPTPASFIDTMKKGIGEILNGDTAGDCDWQWYEMMAKRHMLENGGYIHYDPKKVR